MQGIVGKFRVLRGAEHAPVDAQRLQPSLFGRIAQLHDTRSPGMEQEHVLHCVQSSFGSQGAEGGQALVHL